MEVFLLLLDEIDDLIATFGLIWRRVLGTVCALLLFGATGFVLMRFSVLSIAIPVVLSFVLLDVLRRRRQYERAIDTDG